MHLLIFGSQTYTTSPMGIFSSILGNAGSTDPQKLRDKYAGMLLDTEEVEIGFKLFRDTFLFTNRRMILIDKQGITGRKTEMISIPYKSISRFSVETAGTFDLDGELKIWISSETQPSISKTFNSSVNVYEVQKLLTKYTS